MGNFIVFLLRPWSEGDWIGVRVRLDWKKEILLTVKSNMELKTRSNSCKKEPETIDWLTDNLRDGDIFYDVGANVGAYSLVAASINDNIKVYSFEPGESCPALPVLEPLNPLPLPICTKSYLRFAVS